MKLKFLSKDNEKDKETKQVGKKLQKEQNNTVPKRDSNLLQIPGLQQYSALMKLRIAVSTIFMLCTIAMILIFANGYIISAILLLVGYILLFILLLKLFRIKHL
jgi:Flp pilus assembly protein TadB